jgi:hypothetical protein
MVVETLTQSNGENQNDVTSQFLEAALEYAKLGLPVVCLHQQSKRPRFLDWQQKATADVEALTTTWQTIDLDSNVGIAMGRGETRIIDLECDCEEATKEYEELFDGQPPRVPTFMGRRGQHHIFKWREGLPDVGFFHAGNVEVRLGNGDRGAQSVFPPSIHPDGTRYEWVPGLSIHDVPPGELPDEVVAKLVALCKTEPKKADGSVEESEPHDVAISKIDVAVAERERQAKHWLEAHPGMQAGVGGQVNEKVSWLAIHLLWGFALPAETAAKLLTVWGERPDQTDENGQHYPWTEHEMCRKVEWALGREYGGTVGDRLYRSNVIDDSGLEQAFSQTAAPASTVQDLVAPPPTLVRTIDVLHSDIKEAEKRKRRKSRKGYSILALDALPPVQWQIAEHWTVGGFNCLYGPPSSGKSFVALDQALCIATGKAYLSKFPVKQGPVCYVAAEGASGIRKRIHAWLKYHRVSAPSNFMVIPEIFNLLEKDEAKVLAEIAREALGTNPAAIFIDTLARNFGGGDENATKDMNQFIDSVSHLGRICSGASVYVLHHTGKDFTKGARGSIALTGACDSMVSLSGGPKAGVEVRCTKQKDAAEFRVYCVQAHHVTTDKLEDSLVLVQESAWKQRLRALNDGQRELYNTLLKKHAMKPFSFSDGQATAGGSKSTYKSRLKGLEDLQLVHRNEQGDYFLDSQAVALSLLG